MKYCCKCLQPDTRPNTVFTEAGLCPACEYYNATRDIDWQERFDILTDLIQSRPKNTKSHFDCIIGVSGGKDSTRQALWVRDKLGLRPLLVSLSHPPQQISHMGVDNISNLVELGFDVVVSSPAPDTWRKLMRDCFFQFANWARSSELALFSSVPQLAIRYGIPLIFWGENPALQVGDLKTMGRNGYDGNNLRYSNTLSSGHQWMLDKGYSPSTLIPYIYPTPQAFNDAGLQIIYLGWFLGDWSLLTNADYASGVGLHLRDAHPSDTGDLYGVSNLDEDWHNMNQMIKYLKFGFGKVTEYVNEELRSGTMTRTEAVALVEKYDGACSDQYIASFCDFIGISTQEFWTHIRSATNTELFSFNSEGVPKPRFTVGVGL